ncbi:MAG TPA: prepilin-type N-terminal cleavage/methylation domain-containing protein [Candidatus Paceibacterota bacterium]
MKKKPNKQNNFSKLTAKSYKLKAATGFTMIELLMTIAIIGIFSGVIFASLDKSRAKSRDAVRVGDLKSLSLAAERYFSEYFEFPAGISDLDQYFTGGVPKDPKGDSYFYAKYDINGAHKYCFGATIETSIASPSEPDILKCSFEVNYKIEGP